MNKEQHIYMHYLIKNMDQVDQDLQLIENENRAMNIFIDQESDSAAGRL